MPSGVRVRLVTGASARARGADEHIVLHLLAVLFAVRVLPDPGAVALDDLAVDRRLPRHGVLASSKSSKFSVFSSLPGSLDIPRCCYVVPRGNNERRRRVLETKRVAPRGPRGDTKKRHRAGPTARL